MVWFHGGGFSIGSGNMRPWATSLSLPQHGVVLVTVNHRLGPMGLLALPALSKESPYGVSGNYLFLDLIAALQWVQRNIAAFGGDPNCVTIFGESGGAGKVDVLLASPLAKGLFHRAILQSGVGELTRIPTLKEAEALGEMLVTKYLGIDPNDLATLRAIPAEKIIKAAINLTRDLGVTTLTGMSVIDRPVVDGWLLPDSPTNIFKAGKQNNVPFIVCANLGELIANKTFLRMPGLIKAYVDRLSSASKLGTKAYACIFSHVPSKWREEGVLAYHGLEVMYVFGDLALLKEPQHFYIFARPSGATQPDPGLTEEDKWVAEAMMTMWVQFAKTGDPSVEGLVTWPAWEPTTDQYLEIAWPLRVKSGFSKIVKP
jgi:para-nitrobenzyl esterase